MQFCHISILHSTLFMITLISMFHMWQRSSRGREAPRLQAVGRRKAEAEDEDEDKDCGEQGVEEEQNRGIASVVSM